MAEEKIKSIRLASVAKELNVGIATIVDHLAEKGLKLDNKPTAKLTPEMYEILLDDYQSDKQAKEASLKVNIGTERKEQGNIEIGDIKKTKSSRKLPDQEEVLIKNLVNFKDTVDEAEPETQEIEKVDNRVTKKDLSVKVVGKIDLDTIEKKPTKKDKDADKEKVDEVEAKETEEVAEEVKDTEDTKPKEPEEVIRAKVDKLQGPTVVGKIDLPEKKQPKLVASSGDNEYLNKKKKRKRKKKADAIDVKDNNSQSRDTRQQSKQRRGKKKPAEEVSDKEVQEQIKETLAKLGATGKSKGAKHRRQKRAEATEAREKEQEEQEAQKNVIQVTEFSTVSELAKLMDVSVNDIIASCMELGIFVSINQRLDAETMSVVSDEFGYKVEFVDAEVQEAIEVEEDLEVDLQDRPPIVTVMGHVDHGKTSLLDYVRKTNVIAGEAGGITQHIGAYEVELESGKMITFIDTPGHEAFTAMRARGAQVTDIAVIIVAADDNVMPQTTEAINHAQAAGVPMVFAINKIDKEGANPDSIKEQLSNQNILLEDWGGKYQSQDISAKNGVNIDELLVKILLEAEMLELKANPNKKAVGTVIEATMEKGKGIVTTVLVQAGTLRIGDVIVAGCFFGKVKAMFDERGHKVKEAGPSCPVQILGFNGAPQAGDNFNMMSGESEAKEVANKRLQLQREQGMRTHKHITLDEVGRRLAIGNFKELNLIVRGDVDGSVEALSDSLLKLSTDTIQINIIHKSVGQISDSDVMLATASDAIIIGFQVRPSVSARKLAETEQIDIRLYSVIYNAIEEIKSALEGMLEPTIEEKIISNIEIREVFKITKVGTVAGCMVLDGKITRNTKIRVIRDGVVGYSGTLSSLKRFKEDVKEVASGYECGLSIENYNDIKVGDIIEGYEEVEVKATLA